MRRQTRVPAICEDRRDGQFFGSSRVTVSFAVGAKQQIRTLKGNCSLELFQHVPRRVIRTPGRPGLLPQGKILVAFVSGECRRHASRGGSRKAAGTVASGQPHEPWRRCGMVRHESVFSETNELCLQYTSIMMQCASRSEVWSSLKKGDATFLSSWKVRNFTRRGSLSSRCFMRRSCAFPSTRPPICRWAG